MDAITSSRTPTSHVDQLIHPIPQRRYAFVTPHEDAQFGNGNGSVLSGSIGIGVNTDNVILRPVSAPAGLATDFIWVPRPSSPLSRVGNPMVRDGHFRRFAATDSLPSPPHIHTVSHGYGPTHPHPHSHSHAHTIPHAHGHSQSHVNAHSHPHVQSQAHTLSHSQGVLNHAHPIVAHPTNVAHVPPPFPRPRAPIPTPRPQICSNGLHYPTD